MAFDGKTDREGLPKMGLIVYDQDIEGSWFCFIGVHSPILVQIQVAAIRIHIAGRPLPVDLISGAGMGEGEEG